MKNKPRSSRLANAKQGQATSGELKAWLANEAARIYVTEQTGDLHQAKLKAALRVGDRELKDLPSNEDVGLAIRNYQALFSSAGETQGIQNLEQKAITALTFFERFQPRIVGALVNGTATSTSSIYLHLFSDHAEAVDWFLMENKLPHEGFNKVYYLNNQSKATNVPAYRFIADETPIELAVFPEVCLRQPVRCSPKGQTLKRESLAGFKQHLGARL